MRFLLPLAVCLAIAAPSAQAREEHVGRNAERGDPARWSEPADTPEKRYEAAVKEARAAQAEALKECRGSAGRAACEAEARRQYQADMQRARDHLPRRNPERS